MPRKMRVQIPGGLYHHPVKQPARIGRPRLSGRYKAYEHRVERRRLEEMDPEALESFRNAWCLGNEAFRKECLEKLALAAKLRRETILSIKQIADRLNLGKPKGAKSNLHRWMSRQPDNNFQPKLDIS